MMKKIRESAKPIFIIVIIAFVGTIIFAWGMDITSKSNRPPNAIGRINDQDISITVFSRTYESKYQELLQTNTDPNEEDLERLRDETWNTIVGQTLIAQQIREKGIQITNEELAEYVKVLPPNELYQSEDMQTDGQFDPMKYQNYLQNLVTSPSPQAHQILLYIESTVKSQVLMNKLQGLITSTAFISDSEVYEHYTDRNEKVKVKYSFISEGDVDTTGIEITEEMLLDRYELDKDVDFKKEETATLKYVSFEKKPSQADIDSLKKDILAIHEQLKGGADFAELALEHSQDRSGQDGGDLGWFGRNKMVKPFEAAAFALENINDFSEPVESQFGWHIIKLTGKRNEKNAQGVQEDQIKASHILLKSETTEQTLANLRDEAERFRQEATDADFDAVAEEFGLSPETTNSFLEGANIPGIGPDKILSGFAFKAKPGSVSEISDSRNAYIVAAPGAINPAGYEPFEDVKTRLQSKIRRELINDKTYAKGNDFYRQMIDQNLNLDKLTDQEGLTAKETDFFSRNDFVQNVGSDPDFIGTAFNLSQDNRLAKPIESRTGCYLMEFIDKQAANQENFEVMSDSLHREALTKKRQDIWSKWYRDIFNNSTIQDFREDIYG
ncbi:MAG: hypothetical protein GY839_17035 [candidate division Zixibacteria bacterium]|nr:hypothetical protein [candidate division Zixibacteria bacterium]